MLLVCAVPARADAPSNVVQTLNLTILDTMRSAAQLGYQGRYNKLAPVLKRSFNFPLMSRVAVGQHWNNFNEQQRAQLVDAFTSMSIATFASRFDDYSGETWKIDSEQPLKKSVLVKSRLAKPGSEGTRLDYLMREFNGQWQVIDVYLDSKFSELATRKAEYVSVLNRSGFNGLMQTIANTIHKLQAGG
jgi:phospholipid transport system substrate-binding protein